MMCISGNGMLILEAVEVLYYILEGIGASNRICIWYVRSFVYRVLKWKFWNTTATTMENHHHYTQQNTELWLRMSSTDRSEMPAIVLSSHVYTIVNWNVLQFTHFINWKAKIGRNKIDSYVGVHWPGDKNEKQFP